MNQTSMQISGDDTNPTNPIKAAQPYQHYYQDDGENGGDDDLAAAFFASQSKKQQQRQNQHETIMDDWVQVIPNLTPGDFETHDRYTNTDATNEAFHAISSEEKDVLELAARYRAEIKDKLMKSLMEDMQVLK